MYRQLTEQTVRWRALPVDGYQGEGLCQVDLKPLDDGIIISGMAIGAVSGRPFAAQFRLECGADWVSRRLLVETTDGRSLDISSDGEGNWSRPGGQPIPELAGAIDIDLQASPLTNTLPIRRLDLRKQDGPAKLTMAYIPFDTFEPYAHRQNYTCLQDGRLYRYENADGSFSADLAVDEDGIAIDYPTLFERLPV